MSRTVEHGNETRLVARNFRTGTEYRQESVSNFFDSIRRAYT